MARSADQHLTQSELEALVSSGVSQKWELLAPDAYPEDISSHMAQCEECRLLAAGYTAIEARLASLRSEAFVPRRTDCPSEEQWLPLAAGLLPEDQSYGYVQHAAECDHCGLLLRNATEDLANQLTKDEESILSSLRSADPHWQRAFAGSLSSLKTDKVNRTSIESNRWKALFRWPRFAFITGTVAIAAALMWLAVTMLRPPSVEQLLTQAYSENRTFEMRFPGAGYAPLRQERGSERSRLSRSRALLKAESDIADHLAKDPEQERWIIAKGKAELLEGQYSEAINSFTHAIELQSHSAEPIQGLAISYFEQAESQDSAVGYGKAVELLNQALERDPENPTILFNRALALERLLLYNEAARDWEHYLRLDPHSGWSSEATKHLKVMREKLRSQISGLAAARNVPLFVHDLSCTVLNGRSVVHDPSSPYRDEVFLDAFVRNLLPPLVSNPSRSLVTDEVANISSPGALECLSTLFEIRHHDAWLTDVVKLLTDRTKSTSHTSDLLSGIHLLAEASRANSEGDADTALSYSKSALQAFLIADSAPGAVRAREEITHAFVRKWRAKECIESAVDQIHEAKMRSYSWIMIQGLLWQSTCRAAEGQLDVAHNLAEEALRASEYSDYESQHLEAILYSSAFLRAPQDEWQNIRVLLGRYWSGVHDPIHAFEAYTELAILAEDLKEYRLARDLRRESLEMIEETSDKGFQAEAHYRLGMAARMAGNLDESEIELKAGLEAFRTLPSTPANSYLLTASAIDLAALDLQRNDLDHAEALLESPAFKESRITDSLNALNYDQVSGELYLRRGDFAKAEKPLVQAISIAEARLRSLNSESDRLDWEADAGPAYRNLVELSLRRNQATLALDAWEAFRGAPFHQSAAIDSPLHHQVTSVGNLARPYAIPKISGELLELKTETIISYAILSGGLAAWAFDDRGVHFVWRPLHADDLRHQVVHFEQMCSDPTSDQGALKLEALSLYDVLIAPFEEYLDPARLLVLEPDTPLRELPWSALVDSQGHNLIERFAISVSPGLEYFRRLKSYAQFHRTDHALIVSAPSLRNIDPSRFSPLPDAVSEVESVATRFIDAHILSGDKVTLAEIRNNLPKATVLHFAGHAVGEADGGGLIVESTNKTATEKAAPSLLSAHDFETWRMSSLRLVVLSACSTAQSKRGLTGADSFVRVFLRAGIPHVVASQWAVDSSTAADTMDFFYAHLLIGETVPRALQSSICQVRRNPVKSHPYYWSVFGAYGK